MSFSCMDQKCSEFNCGHYGIKMESLRPSCQKLYFVFTQNGRGQTGKCRSLNIFWPALESFVLLLSTTYLKTRRAARFADRLRLGPRLKEAFRLTRDYKDASVT